MENNAIIVSTLDRLLNVLEARSHIRVFEETENGSEMRYSGTVMQALADDSTNRRLKKYLDRTVISLWVYVTDTTILIQKGE